MKVLHLFHADVVRGMELEFVHGGGRVEVDVISKQSWFEGESHTLHDHFLIKVRCAEGGFAEVVDESTQRLILFLSDTEKG